MCIGLRKYIFLGAAAIRQEQPDSVLFRLPALQQDDVIDWMDNIYPDLMEAAESERCQLNVDAIQSRLVAEQLCAVEARLSRLDDSLDKVKRLLEHLISRTNVLSPSRGVENVIFTGMLLELDCPEPG
jgi:hypothetical protein